MLGLPEIHTESGIRFVIYSGDTKEPPHVHAVRGKGGNAPSAKFWLDPISLCRNSGHTRTDLQRIYKMIVANHAFLMEQWHVRKAAETHLL